MTKIELTTKHLVELFEEQIDLLKIHCQNYDQGKTVLYKEMAVKLRLLLRETKNQKSLFKQLNLDSIQFINSGTPIDPKNQLPSCSLLVLGSSAGTIMNMSFVSSGQSQINPGVFVSDLSGGGFQFQPCFERHISNESFEDWWKNQIIITDINQNKFSREDIVLSIADTYGGAHIDPSIKAPFYNITNANSIGINIDGSKPFATFPNSKLATFTLIGQSNDSISDPINTPIPPTIRQISEEVILTIESRIKIIKDKDSAYISFIDTQTKRDHEYFYDQNFKFGMPNTFENFQKVINHYFHLRRPDDIQLIYKDLKNKKISLNRLIKCYLRNLEKFKKEEIAIFGHSGNGWSLQGVINKIISSLK